MLFRLLSIDFFLLIATYELNVPVPVSVAPSAPVPAGFVITTLSRMTRKFSFALLLNPLSVTIVMVVVDVPFADGV